MAAHNIVQPHVPSFTPAPQTSANLDYANLPIVDLSNVNSPESQPELAAQVVDAIVKHGFFYVINHGYSPQQTKRIFDIANLLFEQVPETEKQKYTADIKGSGSWQGYKPRQYWNLDHGVRDQLEMYNIHRDITKRTHPEALRPLLPEVEAFAKYSHLNILHPILRLLAIGLELPEETFIDIHDYEGNSESYVRFMKYHPRTQDEEEKTNNVWLKGHTDFGTVTLLYSQPVAALQILTRDGTWKWVKHIENAIVINAGDAMEALSGGYYHGAVHRVIQPPPDQVSYGRLGVFYFGLANDDTLLTPRLDSPVLQRLTGTLPSSRFTGGTGVPTMEQWRKARTSAYGKTEVIKKDKVEEEVTRIAGIAVKHYL